MLRIEPVTLPWADALAEGDEVFARRFGIPVEPGWEGFPEVRPFLVRYAASPEPPDWGPFLFLADADETPVLVGNGGWKGSPVDGVAELGYSVAPGRQGRGIATAALRELVERGRAAGLRLVVAHTIAEPSASTAVLTKCGFAKVADVDDPDDGPLWLWELHLTGP